MRIEKYQQHHKREWDKFVDQAKNSHFLFMRDFMEYHADKFTDHSLLFFNKKDQLIALLPANVDQQTLHSHQGLTFGGFIVSDEMTTKTMLEIFKHLLDYLRSVSINEIVYKCIPAIYHQKPSEEDLYALFSNEARLIRRDVSSTILIEQNSHYSKSRKWGINKAKSSGLTIKELSDYGQFWSILEEVLRINHQVKPVHSLQEIEYLARCFPKNIKLFGAFKEDQLLAGTVLFENQMVAHTQYMANSTVGREYRALDLLIHHLITEIYPNKKYFDFGISTESNGKTLNEGLITQKEEFGAYAVMHDFYELKV
ncbi:MAG: GNAT family N-acetyltransferase [Bacteroidota bacterium]